MFVNSASGRKLVKERERNEIYLSFLPPRKSDFLADLRADGGGEPDLGEVGLDGDDPAAGGEAADVDHEDLALGQLLHLGGLLVALGPDAEEAPQQVVGDLELGVDVGQVAHRAQHLAHHPVSSAQRRVNLNTGFG